MTAENIGLIASANVDIFTESHMAKAFTAWEQRFRDNPLSFMSAEEVARMEAADLGTASAIYFLALLREVK